MIFYINFWRYFQTLILFSVYLLVTILLLLCNNYGFSIKMSINHFQVKMEQPLKSVCIKTISLAGLSEGMTIAYKALSQKDMMNILLQISLNYPWMVENGNGI